MAAMRWAALVLCLFVACKQKEPEPEPAPAAAAPSVGHSSTKIRDRAKPREERSGAKSAEADNKKHYGGDGKPAYRDERGEVHGPGGPIFMGRGPECTDKLDHCLRDGVWFAVGNVQQGKLYRATPVFEFEDKWWTFRGKEASDWAMLFKTKIVESASELSPGSPVIWLVAENSSTKWLSSEYDALTSSRWEAGVIESVGTDSLKVYGWPNPVPIDTVRVIVDQKKSS
jgi:hypothetical protein